MQYPPGMNTLCVSMVLFLIQRCIFVLLKLYKNKLFSKGNISFCHASKYKIDEETGNTDLEENFKSKFYAYQINIDLGKSGNLRSVLETMIRASIFSRNFE